MSENKVPLSLYFKGIIFVDQDKLLQTNSKPIYNLLVKEAADLVRSFVRSFVCPKCASVPTFSERSEQLE